jgi:hypothetical protein
LKKPIDGNRTPGRPPLRASHGAALRGMRKNGTAPAFFAGVSPKIVLV